MKHQSPFARFVLPEREVSLKLVFDNIRNYLICGALLGMILWFASGKASAPPLIFNGPPKDGWLLLKWFTTALFAVLYLLNLYQSYLIARSFFSAVTGEEAPDGTTKANLRWYWHVIIYIVALALTMVVITLSLFALLLAIYLPWFAATGTRP